MASPQSSKGISTGRISSGGSSVAGAAKRGRFGGGDAWCSLGHQDPCFLSPETDHSIVKALACPLEPEVDLERRTCREMSRKCEKRRVKLGEMG